MRSMQTTAAPTTRGQLAAKLRASGKGPKAAQAKASPARKRPAARRPKPETPPPSDIGAETERVKATSTATPKRAKTGDSKASEADSSPSKSTPNKRRSPRKAAVVTSELHEKGERIRRELDALYSVPAIPLDHASAFQLLIAVILSAQTTDKKVNEVSPALFARAPDPDALARCSQPEIQDIIQQIGLAPTKSKNIINTAKLLLERHAGEVPQSFEELEALPGVGHKTASVIMAQCFGIPAFPVDTHIHRLAQRWGLTCGASVEQTEADLKAIFDEEHWNRLHLQIIYFGREHCTAKAHDAQSCTICSWAAVTPFDRVSAQERKGSDTAG